jgi:glutathione synthase
MEIRWDKTTMDNTVLIVGDPLDSLNFSSDSSLAMAEGALSLGYRVYWTTNENIGLLNGTPIVSETVEIAEIKIGQAPRIRKLINDGNPRSASGFNKIIIRKDPPFDQSYTDLCWILSQCEPLRVINNPAALLTYHEKLTPWRLVRDGILPEHMMVPTLISRTSAELLQFVTQQFEAAEIFLRQFRSIEIFKDFKFQMLCKPWRGHGGRGIKTFPSSLHFQEWLSSQTKDKPLSEMLMLQPLLPEIKTKGDRRVFIVNGDVQFDFVRYPASGKIEANLAQGGQAKLEHMPEELLSAAQKIAGYLKRCGILLAGLDFIGERLTEVNITSPTGIRTFEQLSSKKCSKDIMIHLLESENLKPEGELKLC